MRDPAVDGMSMVQSTSLIAIGTPANGESTSPAARFLSIPAAVSSAAAFRCRNAWMSPSTAAIRSRCACVTSTLETSPAARRVASSEA